MSTINRVFLLRRASICFFILGAGYISFGIPFWFLGASDEALQGELILPFLFLIDDLFPVNLSFWVAPISIVAMFLGLYSLWKIAEPSGAAYKRRFHLPMIAAVFYFLGSWMPLPFAPLGALLIGLGMILLGLASIRAKVWPGWRAYTPLLVGCFPFLFMFPLLLITGARPAAMIGLWSIPWIMVGIAAWQRSNTLEES